MCVKWPGARPGVLPLGLILAGLVGFPGQALAQSEGIPLGPFQFFPSFSAETEHDDNVFKQNKSNVNVAGEVSDQITRLRAPLVLELPFRSSLWQLRYTPGVNRYQDTSGLDGEVHDILTLLDLRFSSGAELTIMSRLILDYSNIQDFDPEGIGFSGIDYRVTRHQIDWQHPLGVRHGLSVSVERRDLEFEEIDRPFIDERTIGCK